MGNASRVAKIEIEQDRVAVITRTQQNAQHRNTWDLLDKVDRENLPYKTTKEELQ